MHERLQIGLLFLVIRLVLKERRGDLSRRAGTAVTVYQIGEDLLCLASLKMHGLAVRRKYVKVAEALYSQQGVFLGNDGEAQFAELLLDRLSRDRLHDVAAGSQAHRVAGILAETGDKNNIHLRVDALQFLGEFHAGHTAHVDIQKGDIAAVRLCLVQQILRLVKREDFRVRLCLADRHFEHLQHQRFVVNAQYLHDVVPPLAARPWRPYLRRSYC